MGSCELEYSHEVTGEMAIGLVQKIQMGSSNHKLHDSRDSPSACF
jgi:hypothetical protein